MITSSERRPAFWPAALLLIYVIVTAIWLERYPRVWVDEGWIAEVGAQVAQGEPPGSPSLGQSFRYPDRLFWMPPLYFLELGGVFRWTGAHLLAGRGFNVALGALSTLALFFLLRRRTGPAPAFWAALFFATDTFVWKLHRTIRFESLLVLFGILLFTAILAALEREDEGRPSRGLWLAGGALAGLAANVHPNGAVLAVAVAAMAISRRGVGLFRTAGPWLGATMALLFVLPYGLYLSSDASTGFANVAGQNSYHLKHGGGPLVAPLREWHRWADWFDFPARLPHLAAWVLLIGLGMRRSTDTPIRALLVVLAALVVFLAFLPNKTLLYVTLLAPFVAMLGALAWAGGSRLARRVLMGGVAVALVVNAGLLARDAACRPTDDLARIQSALRPDDRIAGTFVTWWAAGDRPFLEFGRATSLDIVQAFRPTVLIVGDRHWTQEAADYLAPLDAELFGVGGPLHGRAPELSLPESCLGPVRLYRLVPALEAPGSTGTAPPPGLPEPGGGAGPPPGF